MKPPEENNTNTSNSNSSTINTLTKENATESNAIQIPEISLPKGGGALKGIDEKFEVNSANGTAGFSVPLPITPGRNGFSPSLSLSYNSGGGNSPYGLGWDVGIPAIQRKTDKRLPRYRDGSDEDIFMFSGAEDLVPFLTEVTPGDWQTVEHRNGDYRVKRYRPRIEGGFARIERISHPVRGIYWKVTTPDNTATIFGRNTNARIADPEDDTRIFQWLPEFSYDDKGNWIKYEYKEENLENIPNALHEKNRWNGTAKFTNKYLKRVKYGNHFSYYADPVRPYDPQPPTQDEHFFELVFDYGEHNASTPTPDEVANQSWEYRLDAFSHYRAGFEIRTSRLCRRVLMFHRFAELGNEPYLVSSLDLDYEPSSINESDQTEVTYLRSITQTGYIRKPDNTYSEKSLPPMEFEYQRLDWSREIKSVSRENIVNAPVGLTNNYQWVDLYGEGISGILTEQGEGWFYKSNLGDVDEDGNARFTAAKEVIPRPSFAGLSTGALSIQDLDANGKKQVVVNGPGLQGYFELTEDNDWENFKAIEEIANINLQDPNVRLIDLNGDGQPELVVSEYNVFVWYASKGKKGYDAPELTAKPFDEERGPAIVFADQLQTIFLADMSGDGMTDIARIRNGEICYWPNMGYGRFGAKVNMGNAPLFDHPDSFNPQYLHLADVSGTGATDILYLGKNRFNAYINMSGNSWSDVHEIDPSFHIDSNTQLSVIDLLGSGTSCIVWSSDLPGYTESPMRYIDLMSSKKPHVLRKHVNNLGKETTVEYKSSTHFYIADKLAGKPWITKLPFPVQVVSKSIVEEKITDVRFASEYRYHHGYYDHPEREFRGFGMVEQIDSEHYENWKTSNVGTQLEMSEELYQKPVMTRTWYHTGAFLDRERILTQFKDEYWNEEYNRRFPDTPLTVTEPELIDARISASENINDQQIVNRLNADEWREVLRACKSIMLRQEVFALDAPESGATDDELKKQLKPYSVATHNCNIQLLQPRGDNLYGVFLVTESEAITFQYERDETDPRVAHTLNTRFDEFGNVLEAASVVYPRLQENASLPRETRGEQGKTLITYAQNEFAKTENKEFDIDTPETYRLRLPYEAKSFEITGLPPRAGTLYQLNDFHYVQDDVPENVLVNTTALIGYNLGPTDDIPQRPERRLIEHVRSVYLKDDLTGPLPAGTMESKGIPHESYQLAYTTALLEELFGNKIPDPAVTMEEGGYINIDDEDHWWIRSGTTQFIDTANGEDISDAQARFYSPISFTDPFGAKTSVVYDTESFNGDIRISDGYYLTIKETTDELQNRLRVEEFDYRTLSPRKMRDINDNLSEVIVDELGLVKAVAVMGKGDEADNLDGFTEITSPEERETIQTYFTLVDIEVLRNSARSLLGNATARFVYDLDRYHTSVLLLEEQLLENPAIGECGRVKYLPTVTGNITREEHQRVNPESPLQLGFEYSDGMGNVAMAKVQAEPGEALRLDIQPDCSFTVETVDTRQNGQIRWIGNGRTVLNNKGNPVKQYEPYFSVNPFYEDHKELVETGVTPILYYDSLSRLIRTELPDNTFSSVEFDSWKQTGYDQNDTVMDSQWYNDRIGGTPENPETQAAVKAAKHHNTPSTTHIDTLGRPILSIEHNRDSNDNDLFYKTTIELDIEGNAKKVIDARGNIVMEYKYDILGHRVYQKSMDGGDRWMINDATGQPLKAWDANENEDGVLEQRRYHTIYDELRRPLQQRLHINDDEGKVIERFIYGEGQAEDKNRNLRGQLFQHYDSSGLITNQDFDFKGNLLKSERRLAVFSTESLIHWTENPVLDTLEEIYTQNTEYDALNSMVRQENWHIEGRDPAIYTPQYNERGLLVGETLSVRGQTTEAIINIAHNAKGQRTRIQYGNGTTTRYTYDPETFRLMQLRTTKTSPGESLPTNPSKGTDSNVLQNIYYTYDPVGNITEIHDDAYEPVFFNNQQVEPRNRYKYDALYRLVEATGRENFSAPPNAPRAGKLPDVPIKIFPITDQALRNYTQTYVYDSVGNIVRMSHGADRGSWTRHYEYADDSNRLLKTWQGNDTANAIIYDYDTHGSMLNLDRTPGNYRLRWDISDMIHHVNLGGGGNAFYNYGSDKERSRKRIVRNSGGVEERLYLGGMELFRKFDASGEIVEEIETHHLFDGEQRVLIVEDVFKSDTANLPANTTLFKYQYSNHLGSVGLEIDEDSTIISYEEYHPYGTTAYSANNEKINTTKKRFKYTGMESDEEIGLSYHSARYYLPWLGRWGSVDPIGIDGGGNLYIYASGNPVKNIDLDGTDDKDTSNYEVPLIEYKPQPLRERQAEDVVSGYDVIDATVTHVEDSRISDGSDYIEIITFSGYGYVADKDNREKKILFSLRYAVLNNDKSTATRDLGFHDTVEPIYRGSHELINRTEDAVVKSEKSKTHIETLYPTEKVQYKEDFFKGLLRGAINGILDTFQGAYNTLRHPIQSAEAIYDAATHPLRTIMLAVEHIDQTAKAITSGDAEAIGEAFSNLIPWSKLVKKIVPKSVRRKFAQMAKRAKRAKRELAQKAKRELAQSAKDVAQKLHIKRRKKRVNNALKYVAESILELKDLYSSWSIYRDMTKKNPFDGH
jgi:RHS repeat-associated protein